MSAFLKGLFGLDGCVAIVTGASRGIGAAIALGLAKSGAQVFGVSRSLRPEWDAEDVRMTYQSCDIRDSVAFRGVCTGIYERHQKIDILINAAGISVPPETETGGDDYFDEMIDTNLRAVYKTCMIVTEYMRKSGGGNILNITSINSVLGFPGNPGYVSAKGGTKMLTKALAIDLGQDNIRVNALAPGYIHTDMTRKSYADTELHQQRLRHMILPRWGEPEDLVGAAIFLVSKASSYMTGQDVFVDGGWTAKGLT
jgi:NAD(P)-dependent dehydrogenase (short-subunit alcohol dehydrogenase family)